MTIILLSALSGISLFAAILHFLAGTRPLDKAQLWFSVLCLLLVFFIFCLLAGFKAQTVADMTSALRWQISLGLLFFLLLPWLVAELSARRHRGWLALSSALGLALILVNALQAHTLQFTTIAGLKSALLPWGETIAIAYGATSPWFAPAAGYVLAVILSGLLAFLAAHRREPHGPFRWLALALGIFLLSVLAGLLQRAQLLDIPPPAPLGFLFMILIMSGTLIRGWRARILASEQHYRYLMQQSPRSILRVSPEGRIVDVNAAFERLWGVTAEHVRGYDLLSDEQLLQHGIIPHLRQALAGRANEFPPIVYNPAVNPTLPGPPNDRWVSGIVYPILNRAGKVMEIVLVQDDVTERIRAQAEREQLQGQLLQARKTESIGRLTGGIAHDFNNMLGVILGYAELLREDLSRSAAATVSMQRYVDEILTAGNRAKELIAMLLTFSRRSQDAVTREAPVILLAPVLQEALRLLQASLPRALALSGQFADDTLAARIHPVQLHQILMNFVINARDAIGEHGSITVRLTRQACHGTCDSCHQAIDGEYAVLSVSDTGGGIAAHLLPEIFTPYFTSKPVGKGTGMGLAVVHGLLHDLGGHVMVETRLGNGTTMHALLPLALTAPALTPAAPPSAEHAPSLNGLRLLVVDDEPAMANLLSDLLHQHGATVTRHHRALEALADFTRHPQHFDLVLSDVVMPVMSGLELARRMRQQRPELPIILCTGHSEHVDANSAVQLGQVQFLYKPVDSARLLEAIAGLTQRPPV